MATRTTIARLFDSYADAAAALRDLEAAGFSPDDVSLIASRDSGAPTIERSAEASAASGAGAGATLGTLVGGGAGLLAGIGALAIPGLGPVVAAGWLAALLTGAGIGAAAGGILGALTQAGIGEEQAHIYAEGLRRGGNLVTVRSDAGRIAEAESILARHNPVDTEARASSYRSGGWTRYDAAADPHTGLGTAAGVGTTLAGGQMGTRTEAYPATDAAIPGGRAENPPDTELTRGVDAVAGTDTGKAQPRNEDGSLRGPPTEGPNETGPRRHPAR